MSRETDAILRITDGTRTVDFLEPGSGWRLADPGWRPQIAQLKGGGAYVDSALAEGRTLLSGEYGNVVETIRLTLYGLDQNLAIKTAREGLQLLRQAADYWKEQYEYDDVWIEARPACNDCFIGYSRIIQGNISELSDPYRQPFYTSIHPYATMEDITLVLEREPFWRAIEPGALIGPLYNVLKNSDFELWNFGVADSQPDSWSDLETLWITGTNNRQETAVYYGNYALQVSVTASTLAGAVKGINQTLESTKNNQTYTALAWVRSDGVTNGVGRILITSIIGQYELYRSADAHGWTLYTETFTTGLDDVIGVNCEILTTAANTVGTVYFDGLMIVEGDWEQEAIDGVLPWMSSSHIVNHWDQPDIGVVNAGDINWVDCWDIPGDVSALIRLEFQNNTDPTTTDPVENYSTIRIGQRRTKDVLNFDNFHDPAGPLDATASSGQRVETAALSASWQETTFEIIAGPTNVEDNMGRFRVFARIYDTKSAGDPTLESRLRYFIGASGVNDKILNAVLAPARGQWCIADLTPVASMVQDRKFDTQFPSRQGYRVEMRRSDGGTDIARLDYVLTMPTDGGYIEAELDSQLTFGNSLVIDNTSSMSVLATVARAGGILVFDTGDDIAADALINFNGYIYAGTGHAGAPYGHIFRFGTEWEEVTGSGWIRDFELYQGALHAGRSSDAGGGTVSVIRSYDGVNFTQIFSINAAGAFWELRSFQGELWCASTDTGANTTNVDRWDGSVLVNSLSLPIANVLRCLEVYGGKLYAGADGGNIYEYDPNSGAWTVLGNTGETTTDDMQEFNGKLYMATTSNGRIFTYDGSAIVQVADLDVNFADMTTFGGVLYGGGSEAGVGAPIFQSEDGETWEQIYDTEAPQVRSLYGDLLGLTIGTTDPGANAKLYSIAFEDSSYIVPNFKGTLFTAPNRELPNNPKRHRWVFSYDRPSFVNDIDDKALIGIGFVPRYLALRGRD